MATTAPSASIADEAGSRPARRCRTDAFAGAIPLALPALAVTGIGFWRTFFSRLGETGLAHMLQGASSTGWIKLRGRAKVNAAFMLALAACNLIRLPKLLTMAT